MQKVTLDYIYKKVKVPMKHCRRCGTQLSGNGSEINPYSCSCGTWNYDWLRREFWTIVKE